MQVKKFEAPTIQEALDHVKRELGPEAIILQTKKNKRGFGLMSRASVEVTAAVSDRSLQKKQNVETRVPAPQQEKMRNLPAARQAEIFNKYMDRHESRSGNASENRSVNTKFEQIRESYKEPQKALSRGSHKEQQTWDARSSDQDLPKSDKKITSTRYIDILDQGEEATSRTQESKKPQIKASSPLPSVEDEIKNLKKMLEGMKELKDQTGHLLDRPDRLTIPSSVLDNPVIEEAFEQLVVNGVERRYALSLIKKVRFELGPTAKNEKIDLSEHLLDLIAKEIMDSVRVTPLFPDTQNPASDSSQGTTGYPEMITLIGPTGVGKTTTVAKLASIAIKKHGLKVGLINFDHQKPSSFDQLGTYAKILGVPFRFAASQEDFKAALHDFQRLDLVFIDTAGRSQRDPEATKEIDDLLKISKNIHTYLVLSATTRDNEIYDMLSRFSQFKPKGLIISKLDEATVFGTVYNLSQRTNIPLVSFTIGQKIPDDLEDATPERVAALVMNL